MKDNFLEVTLIGLHDEVPFPETVIDGKTYFEAIPGRSYRIRVRPLNNGAAGKFPLYVFRLELFLDGTLVSSMGFSTNNLSKTTGEYVEGIFKGFITDGKVYPFKFATTELKAKGIEETGINIDEDIKTQEKSEDETRGTIEIKVFPASMTVDAQRSLGKTNLPKPQEVDKDKKFWKLPSVTSTYDDMNISQHISVGTARYSRTSDAPTMTLKAYYHSKALITILKNIHSKDGDDNNDNDADDNDDDGDDYEAGEYTKKQHVERKRKRKVQSVTSSGYKKGNTNLPVVIDLT